MPKNGQKVAYQTPLGAKTFDHAKHDTQTKTGFPLTRKARLLTTGAPNIALPGAAAQPYFTAPP
jgi:hypothetical protein